jgi:hypothetical protein
MYFSALEGNLSVKRQIERYQKRWARKTRPKMTSRNMSREMISALLADDRDERLPAEVAD